MSNSLCEKSTKSEMRAIFAVSRKKYNIEIENKVQPPIQLYGEDVAFSLFEELTGKPFTISNVKLLKELIDKELDFSTPVDKALFWCGRNQKLAIPFTTKFGKYTLAQTSGGKFLASLNLYETIEISLASEIWDMASKKFSIEASGIVDAIILGEEGKYKPSGEPRTWWRTEYPTLLKNRKITKIRRWEYNPDDIFENKSPLKKYKLIYEEDRPTFIIGFQTN